MLKKMLTLSLLLVGTHLLLGLALLVVLQTAGIRDGLGYFLHLLFGLPNLPAILLLGSLGLATELVTINVMLLMLVGIPQWIVAGILLALLDEVLLWMRVRAENSIVQNGSQHLDMLAQLKAHNKFNGQILWTVNWQHMNGLLSSAS